jgi:aminopeptidase YwaD
MRMAAAAAAALSLLSACANYYTVGDISPAARVKIAGVVALVEQSRMDADLSDIEQNQDGEGLYRRTYAGAQLEAAGLSVSQLTGTMEGHAIDNLYAEIPGLDPGLAPVLVMAHWDKLPDESASIRLPAMDDNASGLVGVLECARAVWASGASFRRTLRFVLFDEEEGGMLGSKLYASSLGEAQLPSFFVNFEMIAYTAESDSLDIIAGQSRGDWIGAYAPDWAASCPMEFARSAQLFVPGLKYYAASMPNNFEWSPLINNIARSDHIHFWKRGVPGLMITDGAEMRNPNYHRAGDTKASLDLAFMTNVVRASLATALARAEPVLP